MQRSAPRWRGVAVRAIAIGLVVAGLVVLLAGTDTHQIAEAFRRARAAPLVLVAVMNFGIVVSKARAWQIMLRPDHEVSLGHLTRYTLVAYATSVVLPFRSGELVRLWLLRDRDGVPVSRGAATAIAEKLLDIVSMLLVVAPLPFLLPRSAVTWWIGGLAVLTIALLLALRVLAARLGTEGWRGELARGLAVVRDSRCMLTSLAYLTVGWLIDAVMIALVLCALDLPVSIAACCVVLFTMNVSIALPSTPASVGALELGAVVGLALVNVGRADAIVFGILYHVLQVGPICLAGLTCGAFLRVPALSKMKSNDQD